MEFKHKVIFFGILPWLLVIGLVIIGLLPAAGGLQSNYADLNAKKAQLMQLEDEIDAKKDTSKLEQEVENQKLTIKGFNLLFPEHSNLEPFYTDLENAMKASNVNISSIAISKEDVVSFPSDFFDLSAKKDSKSKTTRRKRTKKGEEPYTVTKRAVKFEFTSPYSGLMDILFYINNYYRFMSFNSLTVKVPMTVARGQRDLLEAEVIFDVFTINKNDVPPEEKKKSAKK